MPSDAVLLLEALREIEKQGGPITIEPMFGPDERVYKLRRRENGDAVAGINMGAPNPGFSFTGEWGIVGALLEDMAKADELPGLYGYVDGSWEAHTIATVFSASDESPTPALAACRAWLACHPKEDANAI